MGLIIFLVIGLIAGFIARAVVPGDDSMGIIGTLVLGLIGSFVGGTLASLIGDGPMDFSASGLIGSIIGAIIALIVFNMVTGRKRVA